MDSRKIWFVVHHQDLFDVDKNLIGFKRESQRDELSVGDIVIYYRTGIKQFMGVYKITSKGYCLNRNFKNLEGDEYPHQCRLELLTDRIKHFYPTKDSSLSFHAEWVKSGWGRRYQQVFQATYEDLVRIVADASQFKDLLQKPEQEQSLKEDVDLQAQISTDKVKDISDTLQCPDNKINFLEEYKLPHNIYLNTKSFLCKSEYSFLNWREVYFFDDKKSSIQFLSERLIPEVRYPTKKPLLLLFSNPHPQSVKDGMLHTPNFPGGQRLFWGPLSDAGFCTLPSQATPESYRRHFLNVLYSTNFQLYFDCLYSFPTNKDPKQLKDIFGVYFNTNIIPQSNKRIQETLSKVKVNSIICFNKDVFEKLTKKTAKGYCNELNNGKLIKGQINNISVYLTYPTGYRYSSDPYNPKVQSLINIRNDIRR